MSNSKKLLETFIEQITPGVLSADQERILGVLRHLLDKQDFDLFQSYLTEARKVSDSMMQDEAYFYFLFRLKELLNSYNLRMLQLQRRKHFEKLESFDSLHLDLDNWYALTKLFSFTTMTSLRKRYDKPFEYYMKEELISFLQKRKAHLAPRIKIYLLLLQMEEENCGTSRVCGTQSIAQYAQKDICPGSTAHRIWLHLQFPCPGIDERPP